MGGFSINDIADKTLRAFGFRISVTGYLEEGSPHFTNVTDLELTAMPAVVNNPGWIVTDSKEEMVKRITSAPGANYIAPYYYHPKAE